MILVAVIALFLSVWFVYPRGIRGWMVTIAVAVMAIIGLGMAYRLSPSLPSLWHGILLSAALVYFTASDLLYMSASVIPSLLFFPLLFLGILEHGEEAIFSSVICLAIGLLAYVLSGWKVTRPREFSPSLGALDIIVMVLSGPSGVPGVLGVMIGMIIGGVVGLALLVVGRKRLSDVIPYVPPLAVGSWIGYLISLVQ